MKQRILIFILLLTSGYVYGQEITLSNASFEGIPHRGRLGGPKIDGWYDCGQVKFSDESPPDLHPLIDTEVRLRRSLSGLLVRDTLRAPVWQVTKRPTDGKTYLGMVTRTNDTWESIAQRLSNKLEEGKCYSFGIELCRSEFYVSGGKTVTNERSDKLENYTDPIVLRIWGGRSLCETTELLGESVTVSNDEWRTYDFEFTPSSSVNYIILEAYYKVPVLIPYNGHLLLDNASTIKRIPCDENEELETESDKVIAIATPNKPKPPKKTAPTPRAESLSSADVPAMDMQAQEDPNPAPKSQKKILPQLTANSYKKGQIIRINDIYFEHDSSSFDQQSLLALDEIVEFLERNDNLVIEVGGHTSTVPSQGYCDELSSKRAKAVATFIAKNGISTKRVWYKGYGKRKPIVPNDRKDMDARKKNQRVELKILMTDFTSG